VGESREMQKSFHGFEMIFKILHFILVAASGGNPNNLVYTGDLENRVYREGV